MSIVPDDHIGENINWERPPRCTCGQLKTAVENKYIFVSNLSTGGSNNCYIIPLAESGEPFNADGIHILNCPWCGDKIDVKKKY
jgi:hypothetical protein